MPFGLTGAPAEFSHMTALKLHDLIAKELIELFVDDGSMAANIFEEMMDKLHKIFQRIRETGLSLSAKKTKLFMTQAVFAGATVRPKGVQLDLAKLTAVVNWEQPPNALNLAGFLGLTGWFRDLIKGYATVKKPLRDLLRDVDIPQQAMLSYPCNVRL
jgi:hypothetical protein